MSDYISPEGLDAALSIKMCAETASPLSSLSLGTSNSSDPYQKEIVKLKQQVLQLQNEKKSLTVRLKGMETLSTLLQDSKKERIVQANRLQYLEAAIARLQNRLLQLGASTSLNLEEDEIFIPPISKDFSDNLLKECCRLKEEVRLAKTDPMEIFKSQQETEKLKSEIENIRTEMKKLIEEKAALESSVGSKSDDKDVIIQKLRHELQAIKYSSIDGDLVCKSLNEETESLRAKLKVTGKQCQDLAKRLQEKEKLSKDMLNQMPDTEKDQTKRENQTLKNQLKEVVQMNTRWQQYNDERENHVHKLTEENALLKQKVEQAQAKVPTLTEEQQQQIDRLLLQAKERIEHEREEKERVQGDLHAADMTISQQEEEIQRLSTLLETEGSAGQRPQDRELIEFLQCQIQSCTEDFELERRDRETAQTKISDLQSELQYVKDQLAYLQRQQNGNPYWQRREEALQMYRDGHNAHNAQGLVSRGRDEADVLLARDIVVDGGNDNNQSDDDYGFDEIDGAGIVPLVKDIKVEDEPMQCPRCKREYSSNKVDEFMEHVDICCD